MPVVDLSRIGLVGQEAYDAHMFNQEQTRLTRMDALAKGQEVEQKERDNVLDQEAAAVFERIGRGDNSPPDSDALGGEPPASRADAMRQAGDVMMQNGAPDRGMKFYKAADETEKAEADAAKADADGKQAQLEYQLSSADLVYRYMGTPKNQSEYDAGRDYLLGSSGISEEHKEYIRQLPDEFDPQVTRVLADHAIAAKDRAQLELTERQREQQERNLAATDRYRMSSLAIQRAQLAETVRQHDLERKSGKSASAPDKNELESVGTAVSNQIFGGEVPAEDDVSYKAGVQSIAARAKTLVKDNPSLDWDVAVSRAILESKTNGDWKTTTYHNEFFGYNVGKSDKTSKRFDPTPLPMTKDNKPDTKALIKGQVYITTRGRARWTGKNFESIAPAE